jgi:hypothetical protein
MSDHLLEDPYLNLRGLALALAERESGEDPVSILNPPEVALLFPLVPISAPVQLSRPWRAPLAQRKSRSR